MSSPFAARIRLARHGCVTPVDVPHLANTTTMAAVGVGSALLAALIDTGERWLGLNRLQVSVFTDNHRAIALYRRFGFEVEVPHRASAFRDGALADAHTMARIATALRPAAPSSPPA
jgi:putative acetyltransferase